MRYEISPPSARHEKADSAALYIHPARGRRGREIDQATERFVDDTRMGTTE